mgnify:CR=1 FL=1
MPEDTGEMNPEIKKTDLTPSELKAIEDRKYFMCSSTPQGGTEKSPVYRGLGKANSFNKEETE